MEDWKINVDFYLKEVNSPFFLELNRLKICCYKIENFQDKIVVDVGGGTGFFLVLEPIIEQYLPFFGRNIYAEICNTCTIGIRAISAYRAYT